MHISLKFPQHMRSSKIGQKKLLENDELPEIEQRPNRFLGAGKIGVARWGASHADSSMRKCVVNSILFSQYVARNHLFPAKKKNLSKLWKLLSSAWVDVSGCLWADFCSCHAPIYPASLVRHIRGSSPSRLLHHTSSGTAAIAAGSPFVAGAALQFLQQLLPLFVSPKQQKQLN